MECAVVDTSGCEKKEPYKCHYGIFIGDAQTHRQKEYIPGENKNPNLEVPKLCPRNKTTRMAIEIGIVSLLTDALATAIPSTAEVTETAGVKMPSQYVSNGPRDNANIVVNIPSAIVKLVPKRHCNRRSVDVRVHGERTYPCKQRPAERFFQAEGASVLRRCRIIDAVPCEGAVIEIWILGRKEALV